MNICEKLFLLAKGDYFLVWNMNKNLESFLYSIWFSCIVAQAELNFELYDSAIWQSMQFIYCRGINGFYVTETYYVWGLPKQRNRLREL
jgi:hypothetical protein